MDIELDIVNIVQATRKAAFLTKLEPNGHSHSLIKFYQDYRIETSLLLPEKTPDQQDLDAAQHLDPINHNDAILIARING